VLPKADGNTFLKKMSLLHVLLVLALWGIACN